MSDHSPALSVVVPMYNEEDSIAETHRRLSAAISGMGVTYEIIYIDDGSRDASAGIVSSFIKRDDRARLLGLSRNYGHQIAVTAGLDAAAGGAIVIIDADLQDPPEVIPVMYQKYLEGFDVVYGKRKARNGDSAFKRGTAFAIYRTLNALTSVDIPADTGDFRLVSKRAADAVRSMREHDRFLRGMFAWIGFNQTAVEFDRDKRFAGTTHYPMSKMIKLAVDGVLSFSIKPLDMIFGAGIALMGVGILWLLALLVLKAAGRAGFAIPSLAGLALLCTGMILTALGVVGGYVGRTFREIQNRPLYNVSKREGFS
jgi:dolichol-phosphate mannosyltransferase